MHVTDMHARLEHEVKGQIRSAFGSAWRNPEEPREAWSLRLQQDLAPGPWFLRLDAAGIRPVARRVEVVAGEVRRVERAVERE
jgi:hypothetical protein